ncbi:MAG: hypothetical protein M3364_01250 [Actinomycetota bacterium]|nr:hypothetical protein [Actinomycetota bacterium]
MHTILSQNAQRAQRSGVHESGGTPPTQAGLKSGHARTLYVNKAKLADNDPFADIATIFDVFASP